MEGRPLWSPNDRVTRICGQAQDLPLRLKDMNIDIYKKSLSLLAIREHSRYELQQKLLQRGYACEEIAPVLDQLVEQKFQSDARFAESYVHSRSSKGYGPERIRLELQQRGVADWIVGDAIATADTDWQALTQKVYQKKFGSTQPQDFEEKIKRQQFMRYRGFNPPYH